MSAARLQTTTSSLAVIDIQEKLLAVMPGKADLLRNAAFLIEVARRLGVPTLVTEQYPKGLGPTHPDLAQILTVPRHDKLTFSCAGAPGFLDDLRTLGRNQIVLCGMESHVCVLNTALDLLEESFEVFLAVDAIQSRFHIDHEVALRRLENAGCILVTVETVAFEWLGGSNHPDFKSIRQLVQRRTQPPSHEPDMI